MTWIVVVSVLMRGIATVWSLVLWRRIRDPRMLFPTFVLALMTASQAAGLVGGSAAGLVDGAYTAQSVTELLISLAAMIGVPLLSTMIDARRRVVADLETSEARMRQVLDLVPHMIFAKDWNSRFLLANKSLATAYGKSVEELLGAPQKDFQLSAEELEHFLADDRAVMQSGQRKFIPEEPFTDNEGRIRILETTKIPFTASGSTERAMLGVAVDITERKHAERRLQFTLQELDHRVKNTLALVLAVAEHAAATTDSVESFVADFRARTMAMARMHDALRRTHWAGADLRELLELALAPYRRDDDTVTFDGPEILVPARHVQAFGMALHELAANSAKHGAVSIRGGRVDIQWGTRRENGEARLNVVWKESGGPPVSPPTRRGLGLNLIEVGLPYEIGGSSRVTFDRDGVRADISLPLGERSETAAASAAADSVDPR